MQSKLRTCATLNIWVGGGGFSNDSLPPHHAALKPVACRLDV